jgi:hypothetical protein
LVLVSGGPRRGCHLGGAAVPKGGFRDIRARSLAPPLVRSAIPSPAGSAPSALSHPREEWHPDHEEWHPDHIERHGPTDGGSDQDSQPERRIFKEPAQRHARREPEWEEHQRRQVEQVALVSKPHVVMIIECCTGRMGVQPGSPERVP